MKGLKEEAECQQLERGQRVTELMKQNQYAPLSIANMALSIYAANEGYLDDLPLNKILAFEAGLHAFMAQNQKTLMDEIVQSGNWDDKIESVFKSSIIEFKKTGSW